MLDDVVLAAFDVAHDGTAAALQAVVDAAGGWTGPSHLPTPPGVHPVVDLLRRGAWRPGPEEIAENPRAEAARLRAVEKLPLPEVA